MKRIVTNFDMYQSKILVLTDCTKEEANAYMKKKYDVKTSLFGENPVHQAVTNAISKSGFYFISVVWVPKIKNDPFHIGMLSHELCHAIMFILERVGQTVDHVNHEHFCYMLQHSIFNTLTEAKK